MAYIRRHREPVHWAYPAGEHVSPALSIRYSGYQSIDLREIMQPDQQGNDGMDEQAGFMLPERREGIDDLMRRLREYLMTQNCPVGFVTLIEHEGWRLIDHDEADYLDWCEARDFIEMPVASNARN